jgi:hypothetical protein
MNSLAEHIGEPLQYPSKLVISARTKRIGLPTVNVIERLLALFRR